MLSVKLEKLKTIEFSAFDEDYLEDYLEGERCEVVLDCPELRALVIDWYAEEAPILKCPKLKHLKYFNYRDWVAKLEGLEVLNLSQLNLRELGTNSESILQNHPKLHTLNLFDVDRAIVQVIIQNKRELGRANLRIYCRSLPVESREVLKEFDQIFKELTIWPNHLLTAKAQEFYSKYEHEFRDDFFIFGKQKCLSINGENFANFKLMAERTSMLRKSHRVRLLKIIGNFAKSGASIDQHELINLLKRVPHVRAMKLYDISFDQSFYDQLPSILPFLNWFEYREGCKLPADFSFLFQFQELATFLTMRHKLSTEQSLLKQEFNEKDQPDFGSSWWDPANKPIDM